MIVLKKLNKDNYLELKLYKLIALLNIIRKILKTIIIRRLSNYIKKYNLFLSK